MDAATALVELFLRVNGYLTLSEWQVQAQNTRGQWDTLTDVDIFGLRFPGHVYLGVSRDPEILRTLLVAGELLMLEPDTIDVIVGEVKEGEAVYNPSLTRHETLNTVLHRLDWLYPDGLADVVAALVESGTTRSRAPGDGLVRTRLVAFGQAATVTENTIPMNQILERAVALLETHVDFLRSAQMSNPVAATLKLLHKSGLGVTRES